MIVLNALHYSKLAPLTTALVRIKQLVKIASRLSKIGYHYPSAKPGISEVQWKEGRVKRREGED